MAVGSGWENVQTEPEAELKFLQPGSHHDCVDLVIERSSLDFELSRQRCHQVDDDDVNFNRINNRDTASFDVEVFIFKFNSIEYDCAVKVRVATVCCECIKHKNRRFGVGESGKESERESKKINAKRSYNLLPRCLDGLIILLVGRIILKK